MAARISALTVFETPEVKSGTGSDDNSGKEPVSELVSRVANGERFVITNRGRPVAEIVPTGRPDREKMEDAIRWMRETREARIFGDLTTQQLRDEGRR